MIAAKPARLTDIEAASAPVIACTAQQMLFDHGRVREGQTVVILGAAGMSAVTLSSSANRLELKSSRPRRRGASISFVRGALVLIRSGR